MKWLRTIRISLLISLVTALTIGQIVFAEDTEEPLYYYTVRLSAGNQGELTGKGVTVVRDNVENPEGTSITKKGGQMVITGLEYDDKVFIYPQDAANATDERYSVRGVRRSGRDNSESVQSTGAIASDMDYVISYRVNKDMVKYTVNYLDEAGNNLLESDIYYGNPGERQYVSARYVEGYLPQAYNLVMTLSQNDAENVFNFRYTPAETGGTNVTEEPGEPGTTAAATGAGTGAAAAGTAGAGSVAAGADAGAADADTEDTDAGVGGDAAVVPDEEVPLDAGPEDIIDLDDEEVPLSAMNQERPGKVMSYLPVYIGIGAAAAIALVLTAVYLKKRRRVPAETIVEKLRNEETK